MSIRPGPGDITTTRSARKIASSIEWVTKSTVKPGARPDLQQLVLQLLAGHGVERAERLVHQHDLGVVGEHARDRDALLHAAGELVRIGVGKTLQADQFDEVIRVSPISLGAAPRLRAEADIVATVSQGNSP